MRLCCTQTFTHFFCSCINFICLKQLSQNFSSCLSQKNFTLKNRSKITHFFTQKSLVFRPKNCSKLHGFFLTDFSNTNIYGTLQIFLTQLFKNFSVSVFWSKNFHPLLKIFRLQLFASNSENFCLTFSASKNQITFWFQNRFILSHVLNTEFYWILILYSIREQKVENSMFTCIYLYLPQKFNVYLSFIYTHLKNSIFIYI